jgi:hypothetical protein
MKRIIAGIMAIGFISLLAGVAAPGFIQDTFASDPKHSYQEHDSETNPDLKLSDNDETWRNGVTATWKLSNMKPGDSIGRTLGFRSTKSASNLKIAVTYVIDERTPVESETNINNFADEFAKKMIITEMRYTGRGNLDLLTTDNYDSDFLPDPASPGPGVKDIDGDGRITLFDLKTGVNVKPPIPSSDTYLWMKLKFDASAGNDFQGDMLDMTMKCAIWGNDD